jgi:ribosomal protein L11 methyltransferase
MRWAEITIESEPTAVDAVGHALGEAGCNGFALDDESVPHRVTGFLPVDDRLEGRLDALKTALERLPEHGVTGVGEDLTVRFVEEADWANAWKAYFKPIPVGKRFVVTPPWEHPELTPEQIPLVIDPGMAFGTGSHPTTQLCLVAIEDYLKPGQTVADIGTGSGILAISAAKLGASHVAANDIDPLAVTIAADNARVNGVSIAVAETLPAGPYDLVVANILADVIIDMAAALMETVKPGGILIVSGIIDTREGDVRAALESVGFSHLEVRRSAEWVALILRRSP